MPPERPATDVALPDVATGPVEAPEGTGTDVVATSPTRGIGGTDVTDVTDVTDGSSPPTATTEDERTGSRSRRTWWFPVTALATYVVCRVATIVLMAIQDLHHQRSLVTHLSWWDGEWFLRAVDPGYPSHLPVVHGQVVANPIAFFPAFPLVIRAGAALGLDAAVVAVVVSGVTGLTAVWAVGLVGRRLAGDAAGARAALLFAVFPGSFIFSYAYSEGIVITAVAFGLLALLDRRWWLAGLLGAVATAGSPVALAFVVSCAWSAGAAIRRERRFGALAAPLLAPVGFVAYMVYLWVHTGQLSAWRMTERGGWASYPSIAYPFRIVGKFVMNPVSPTLTGQILVAGTALAVLGLVLMVRERQPAPIFLYGLFVVAGAAVSLPVGLRPRFLLLAFPMIVAAGTRYTGRTHRILVATSVVLLALMTLLETANHLVFP